MQEWYEAWNEILEEGQRGCCLLCDDAYDGCVCFECKCKRCYWYSSPSDFDGRNGHCDLTDELRHSHLITNANANRLKEMCAPSNPLIEQRVLDLLKFNPDSKEIYKKLKVAFPEEEIDKAFDSLLKKGLIKERIKRVWDGRNLIYEGKIGHWEVVKC